MATKRRKARKAKKKSVGGQVPVAILNKRVRHLNALLHKRKGGKPIA